MHVLWQGRLTAILHCNVEDRQQADTIKLLTYMIERCLIMDVRLACCNLDHSDNNVILSCLPYYSLPHQVYSLLH